MNFGVTCSLKFLLELINPYNLFCNEETFISISTNLPTSYFFIFHSEQLVHFIKFYSNFLTTWQVSTWLYLISKLNEKLYLLLPDYIFTKSNHCDFVSCVSLSISYVLCRFILQTFYKIDVTVVYVLLMRN